MAGDAFDLAEQLQSPVFVLSDLDLGMNNWMSEPFQYPDKPMKRGKILSKEQLEEAGGFSRYKDVDGDAIPYRTLPGTDHPAAGYFTRGSGHDEDARYTENAEVYARNMDRLARKLATARTAVPEPIVDEAAGSSIGLIAYGTTHHAVVEARDLLREKGVVVDYLRLRALPLAPSIAEFVHRHERVYVIEQNRDGQMYDLLRLDLPAELAGRLRSIRHYDGQPIPAEAITRPLLELEEAVPVQ
jgi:2-oxoglutarate ferredoxin oxidoreductase subunit alpha